MPDAAEIAAWLPDDKRQRDLLGLLRMVRYATEGVCRKRTIHEHFGFDDVPESCGSCDVCVATADWQDDHLPAARPIPRGTPPAAAGEAPVQRGDWLDVQGLGLCCVQRVHRRGGSWHADVECAAQLSSHAVDLRRRTWRRVPG
jgi:hypothetical protein